MNELQIGKDIAYLEQRISVLEQKLNHIFDMMEQGQHPTEDGHEEKL
jgi:hypothetical protein